MADKCGRTGGVSDHYRLFRGRAGRILLLAHVGFYHPMVRVEWHNRADRYWYVQSGLALLGGFSRPPIQRFTNAEDNFGYILSETNTDYRWLYPGRHNQVQVECGWAYRQSRRWRQSLAYRFSDLGNRVPEPIRLIRHEVVLTTTIGTVAD